MYIKSFISYFIIYPMIFVGVFVSFNIFELDAIPVSINDALHMTLLYYFVISVYNVLPTIKTNRNKKGSQ